MVLLITYVYAIGGLTEIYQAELFFTALLGVFQSLMVIVVGNALEPFTKVHLTKAWQLRPGKLLSHKGKFCSAFM